MTGLTPIRNEGQLIHPEIEKQNTDHPNLNSSCEGMEFEHQESMVNQFVYLIICMFVWQGSET